MADTQEVNVFSEVVQALRNLMSGSEDGQLALADPRQALNNAGISNTQLDSVNMNQAFNAACSTPGLSQQYGGALQSFGGSQPSFDQVVQQIKVVHEQQVINQNFDDHSIHNDSSVHFTGDVNTDGGDFTFDPSIHNNNATDHSIAGDGTVGVIGDGSNATGSGDIADDGGRVIDVHGPNFGNLNAGDESAQVGGPTNLIGGFGGGERGPILDRLVEGDNGGLDGLGSHPANPVNINIGGGTQQAVTDTGSGDHVNNFGSGDVSQVDHSTLTNSAAGTGGVHNISGNTVGPGGAISESGDAHGHFSDSHDTYTETTTIDNHDSLNSPVEVQQAEGHDIHQHIDDPPHAVAPSAVEFPPL